MEPKVSFNALPICKLLTPSRHGLLIIAQCAMVFCLWGCGASEENSGTWRAETFDDQERVSIQAKDEPLQSVLVRLLDQLPRDASFRGNWDEWNPKISIDSTGSSWEVLRDVLQAGDAHISSAINRSIWLERNQDKESRSAFILAGADYLCQGTWVWDEDKLILQVIACDWETFKHLTRVKSAMIRNVQLAATADKLIACEVGTERTYTAKDRQSYEIPSELRGKEVTAQVDVQFETVHEPQTICVPLRAGAYQASPSHAVKIKLFRPASESDQGELQLLIKYVGSRRIIHNPIMSKPGDAIQSVVEIAVASPETKYMQLSHSSSYSQLENGKVVTILPGSLKDVKGDTLKVTLEVQEQQVERKAFKIKVP